MKGSQETFSLRSSRGKISPALIKPCSIFAIRQFISEWLNSPPRHGPLLSPWSWNIFGQPWLGQNSSDKISTIFFFLFGPENSRFSMPILILGEQRFWRTNNTIKNVISSNGWGILFFVLFWSGEVQWINGITFLFLCINKLVRVHLFWLLCEVLRTPKNRRAK